MIINAKLRILLNNYSHGNCLIYHSKFSTSAAKPQKKNVSPAKLEPASSEIPELCWTCPSARSRAGSSGCSSAAFSPIAEPPVNKMCTLATIRHQREVLGFFHFQICPLGANLIEGIIEKLHEPTQHNRFRLSHFLSWMPLWLWSGVNSVVRIMDSWVRGRGFIPTHHRLFFYMTLPFSIGPYPQIEGMENCASNVTGICCHKKSELFKECLRRPEINWLERSDTCFWDL